MHNRLTAPRKKVWFFLQLQGDPFLSPWSLRDSEIPVTFTISVTYRPTGQSQESFKWLTQITNQLVWSRLTQIAKQQITIQPVLKWLTQITNLPLIQSFNSLKQIINQPVLNWPTLITNQPVLNWLTKIINQPVLQLTSYTNQQVLQLTYTDYQPTSP